MAAGSVIHLIGSVGIETVQTRAPAVGASTICYLLTASDAAVVGTLYTSAAQVDADTDLDSGEATAIKTMLAVGGVSLGGVLVGVYDPTAGPPAETPSDALDGLQAAGYLPGWHYLMIVLSERSDASIADAADWVGALDDDYADMALVVGQSSTASITSGTVPATPAASDGAAKTAVLYDDRDAALTAERYAARVLRVDPDGTRPSFAVVACPPSVGQMNADLTQPQLTAVTGIGVSQARCIAHAVRTPVSDPDTERQWVLGYTVGGTRVEIEYSVARIKLAILVRLAQILQVRASDDNPLRDTPQDLAIVMADVGDQLRRFRARGYLKRRPEGDEALGIPALPEGYEVTGSTGSASLSVTMLLGLASGVREVTITGTGYID